MPSSRITIFTGAFPGANKYMCLTSIPLPVGAGLDVRRVALAIGNACCAAHPLKRTKDSNKEKSEKRGMNGFPCRPSEEPFLERALELLALRSLSNKRTTTHTIAESAEKS